MADPPSPYRGTAPANRLAAEKSPYLLQHASNPVDWYPWGEEAFAEARRSDRPVFLSIGYATCHWCHVMERESFEDPVVARLMNEAFVNIKVDREERPDIDQVYMTVCQMLTGSGGWPLTILMTPDRAPFFAATYLPRESRYGRMGMLDLVSRVQKIWRSERARVVDSTRQILGNLRALTERAGDGPGGKGALVETAYRQLRNRYDERRGGFGDHPKFPSPHNLTFLLHYWRETGEEPALHMVQSTLRAMRLGGIFDQIGFGFHRYSTDSEWLVPHFEKMLYDQAMLVLASTEAFSVSGSEEHRRTAEEILSYVLRDMTSPDGGFYSAEDADSEGEEGRFYLWTVEEANEVLARDDAEFALDVFNLDPEGNYLDESTRDRTGFNIPHLRETHGEAAQRLGLDPDEFARRLERVRSQLFAHRETRIHPLKDDKILADWNGLMAAALARAGKVFGEPRYIDAARASVEFVLGTMRTHDGRLMHRFRDGSLAAPAFLDDFAFLTWACRELYDATLDPDHLERALHLQEETTARFWDGDRGGFFFTANDSEELLVRQKEIYDGAIPSGNSVAMANLVRLARLTGDVQLEDRARQLVAAFSGEVARMPSVHAHLMSGLILARAPSLEVVVVGDQQDAATRRLIEIVRAHQPPHATLLLVPEGTAGDRIRRLAPFTAPYAPIEGRPAAYLCRDFTCELPTTDAEKFGELLEDAAREPSAGTSR